MKRFIFVIQVLAFNLFTFAASGAMAAEPKLLAQKEMPQLQAIEEPWRINHERAIKVIEAHGYDHIQGLVQDQKGIWRGTAIRYGKVTDVMVDQQGNFGDR